jgi:hypothetical protein
MITTSDESSCSPLEDTRTGSAVKKAGTAGLLATWDTMQNVKDSLDD